MPENLTRQILREHLEDGELRPGAPISLRMDQALLQDATGTMALMQFEELAVPRMQLEGELDYFQIPKPPVIQAPSIRVTEEYAAQLLNNFIDMLKKVLREAQSQLYSRVSMTFVSKSFEDFAIAPGIAGSRAHHERPRERSGPG